MKALGLITQIETISRGMSTWMLRVQQEKRKEQKNRVSYTNTKPNEIKPNKTNYKRQKRLYGDSVGIDIYQRR